MSIKVRNLNFSYNKGMVFETEALKDINLELEKHKIYGIIGKTGSGKSTLIQHLNALLLPQTGEIIINDKTMYSNQKNKNLKKLRQEVGLVFQFSEYQLFEETVLKDVAFGPKNFGYSEKESLEKAEKALEIVGIKKELFQRSPFELSGGQKRKVAIAGILAIDPDILVLDEPTAGLDPQSAIEMINLFQRLNRDYQKMIILVTHDFEVAFKYTDEIVLIDKGRVITKEETKSFFNNQKLLQEYNLEKPKILELIQSLNSKGFNLDSGIDDLEILVKEIKKQI